MAEPISGLDPRGPSVLLLHGQPGTAADWDRVIARLGGEINGGEINGGEIIAFDRPGWDGRSRARDLEGNARAALNVLDAHGVDDAIVAGHSLGAAIAAWMAVLHADRVRALVLIAPAANLASLYPIDYWLAASRVGELASVLSLGGLGLALSPAPLRRQIAHATGLHAGYLQAARRVLLSPAAWRAYAIEQRALIGDLSTLERRLGEIAVPTTILIGTGDRIVPARAARVLAAQIPGARLESCPHAGHLLPQTQPDAVAAAIRAALHAPSRSGL
ncbi:MAG: alpha/beta fold hydrolase [Solirubrobacteraceae bacterium]